MPSEQEINEIKDRHSMRLLNIPGVIGVGVEQDEIGRYVLAVRISTDDPSVLELVPDEIEGYPVKLERTQEYRKLPLKSKNRDQD
jgi:hypothetical protein